MFKFYATAHFSAKPFWLSHIAAHFQARTKPNAQPKACKRAAISHPPHNINHLVFELITRYRFAKPNRLKIYWIAKYLQTLHA